MSWIIDKVTCQDIKGFNGRYEFSFQQGLNLIHGPNGQGKSSIVDSLRWALIGELPKVDAIRQNSQSLINKNAGLANGMPEVVVELINLESNENMTIIRRGHKKATLKTENTGLTDGQKDAGMEALEVTVAGEHYSGWFGEAQDIIEEQLGLKSSTLAKCSVVGQDDIMSIIAGKETEMNSLMHDLLDLRTLVEIGPILDAGKKKADQKRKSFLERLEGPASPIAIWENTNSLLSEELEAKQQKARDDFGFDWDEVEGRFQVEEAIENRLEECETALEVELSEVEIIDRVTEIGDSVDKLAGKDPNHEVETNLATENTVVKRAFDDLKSASKFWNKRKSEMSELFGDNELDLIKLAKAKQDKENLYNAKKAEKENHDRSERLASSVLDHLDAHSELDECPICNSPAEYAELKKTAEDLMGAEIAGLRTKLKNEVEALHGEVSDLTAKYDSAKQLHSNILTGLNDVTAVIEPLPDNMGMTIVSADELLGGVSKIASFVAEIERAKENCKERQNQIKEDQDELKEKSETWRIETIGPLRTLLSEMKALIQLRDAYSALDTHVERREAAEIAQKQLRAKLEQSKALKAMLSGLNKALTTSQQENASQRIEDALPEINEIFSTVCANPQYDRLKVDCTIKNGNLVYSFKTLPEQRAFGDVAGVVLSGGNQAVASIAALMALASGDSHQFPTLVLDDPCVQMDPETIQRWAIAASEFANNQQLIVLTHQPEVADNLEANGANREDLYGWDQGVLAGRGDE